MLFVIKMFNISIRAES